MQLNKKEINALTLTFSICGFIMLVTGLIMNFQVKQIIETKYTISIEEKKIEEAQAKTNEIKVKDLEIEINTPLSVYIKDYLDNTDKIEESVLKTLKLDTSRVNINEANTYQYTITYGKKKYVGTIKVKAKELPNITLTLKEINLTIGESLSSNPRSFIKEDITDEVYNNLTLDLSKVKQNVAGTYEYYIIYKGITYQQKIIVKEPGPTIITSKDDEITCPENSKKENNTCTCTDITKKYNKDKNICE